MKKLNTIEDLINNSELNINRKFINNIPRFCQCGHPIVISDSKRKSRCSNNKCSIRLSLRMNTLLKDIGVKGIGEKTCLDWILLHNLKYAIDILKVPSLEDTRLSNVLTEQLGQITVDYWNLYYYTYLLENDKEGWRTIVGTASSVEDITNNIGPKLIVQGAIIDAYKHLFKKVNYQRSPITVEITLTGSIKGFKSRDMFIPYLNDTFGDMYNFKLVGATRKAHILCTDSNMKGHNKYNNAVRNKIPILSSKELLFLLESERFEDFMYNSFTERGFYPYDFARIFNQKRKIRLTQ